MIHRMRITLALGVLALGVAGCQPDGAVAPSIPDSAGVALPGAVAGPAAPTMIGDAVANGWYGSDGHYYSVVHVLGDGVAGRTLHYRDGILYGGFEGTATTNVAEVSFFVESGVLLQESFVTLQGGGNHGPSSVRAINPFSPPPGIVPDTPNQGQQRQMVAPCSYEIGNYLAQSSLLIAAGYYLQRRPTDKTARSLFAAAVVNWAGAWSDLYNCLHP